MGVFAGSSKVKRAIADPGTDDSLSSPGALSWGGITAASALAGTIGADAKLVHGDRYQMIDESQTSMFGSNMSDTIGANETRTVVGNQSFTTSGNVTQNILSNLMTTIIGAEIRSNIGVQNLSHMAPKTRVHAGEELTSEVGAFFRTVQQQFEAHNSKFEILVAKVSVAATTMELAGFKLAVANARTQPEPLRLEASAMRIAGRGLDNLMRGVRGSVVGAVLQVSSMEMDIQTRLQLPPMSSLSPLGVPLE